MNIIKKMIVVASLLVAFGCAPIDPQIGANDYNHGYDTRVDFVTLAGVRIQNNSASFIPSSELIDSIYYRVKSCIDVSFDISPLVILQDTAPVETPDFNGITYFDNYLTIMNVSRSEWSTYQLLNHELIHSFLAASGLDSGQNSGHKSPYFATCME